MQTTFKPFFWGMLVSFLGSLPLGTMNVTVTQIAAHNGIARGFEFAIGSMIVEVIIVRAALVSMKWLARQHKIFLALEYFTLFLILFLAISSFVSAYKMTGFSSSLPVEAIRPFWTGAFLSVTNPLHLPFWLGWSTVLMNRNILKPSFVTFNWYVFGIGVGTIQGFAVFIFAGSYLVTEIQKHQTLINVAIGVVLVATVAIQIKKMVDIPANVRYAKILDS